MPLQVVIELVQNFSKFPEYRNDIYKTCYKVIVRLYKYHRSATFDELLKIILNLTSKYEIMEEAYSDIGPEILVDIYNNGNDQHRLNLLKFLNSKNILTCI